MKPRIQRTDALISLAHDIAPGRVQEIDARASGIVRGEVQLPTRSDTVDRIAWVKMLKAQVDAGTYIIDSRAIVQKMIILPTLIYYAGT